MVSADSRLQIFTFDKETEQKTGALTMLIFSASVYISPLIFGLADIGVSLGTYLLSYYAKVPIAGGALSDQMYGMGAVVSTTFATALVLMILYGIPALRQLLYAYALLEDGRLIKMKWKFRRVYSMKARAIAKGVSKHVNFDKGTARQTINGIYSFLDGLDMMHNPSVIAGHLDGSAVNKNIISMPLDNVTVLKKTKKKLVIMADTVVKNKPKRKKVTIYWMYYDMDTLCRLCEGGRSIVNL